MESITGENNNIEKIAESNRKQVAKNAATVIVGHMVNWGGECDIPDEVKIPTGFFVDKPA